MPSTPKDSSIAVWDLPIRLFHWAMVLCVVMLFVSVRQGWMQAHIFTGYLLAGLLVFRLCWAFVGTTYARLSGFNLSVGGFFRQLKNMIGGQAPHYAGHNPAGAVMVILMIVVLGLQIASGLFYSDDVFWFGPFFFSAPDWVLSAAALLHPRLPGLIVLLVLTHILAVLYHTVRLKEPLVGAMLHGRKPAHQGMAGRSNVNQYWLLFSVVAGASWALWLFTRPL